jgi:DNA-binding PadR family transcriptional regulator
MKRAAPPNLGEFEQLVLLALLQLRDDAYGMQVRRELEARTAREVTIGAVYATLDRLEDKGLVTSSLQAPSVERGGRPKRVYQVTGAGKEALSAARRAFEQMARGLDQKWRPT